MAHNVESADTPLVSVVIPTYNRKDTLLKAVESVAEQTYENLELIIVDDGSLVPAADVLKDVELANERNMTFIRHHENRGANQARNNGIRLATGKYIAFLDDDDWWDRRKIALQVDALEAENGSYGFAYTGKETQFGNLKNTTHPESEGDVTKDIFRGISFGQFSSVMVRSDVIDKAGLPDERFPAWQDREWFLRLSQHTKFKPVPEILTYRKADMPDRITVQFEKRRDIAYPLFLEKHYSFARQYGPFYARMFKASLRANLGRSAVKAGQYGEARKYFLLAIIANPLYRSVYKNFVASIGGEKTYKFSSKLLRLFRNKIKN